MKKSIAMLLAILMLVTALPLSALAASKTMYVKTDNGLSLNVRKTMKIRTDNVLTHLSYGTKVTVLSESGSWARISWGNAKRGYVVKKYLSATKPHARTVVRYVKSGNALGVHMRSSMATRRDNVIATISNGTKVTVIDTYKGGWSKIRANGKIGYMLSKYLSSKK